MSLGIFNVVQKESHPFVAVISEWCCLQQEPYSDTIVTHHAMNHVFYNTWITILHKTWKQLISGYRNTSLGPYKKVFLLLMLFSIAHQSLIAQQTQLTLPQLSACNNDQVIVPVQVENLFDVGAITLYIGYDTALLEYVGDTNINPQFSGMLTNAMTIPQTQIGISWSNVNPANIVSGVMIELIFIHKTNDAHLDFMPDGEMSTVNMDPIVYSSTNGLIQQDLPVILNQPAPIETTAGNSASFTVEATGADTYQWYESNDNGANWIVLADQGGYSGTQSSGLTISSVNMDMDQNQYKCYLSGAVCSLYSDTAVLTVLPEMTALLSISSVLSCENEEVDVPFNGIGLSDIISFEILIGYQPEWADFIDIHNINPLIENVQVIMMPEPNPYLQISWSGNEGITLPNGKLFDLTFNYFMGTANLEILPETYVLHESSTSYNLTTINGQIALQDYPAITQQPTDQFVDAGNDIQFSLTALEAVYFQWFESQDSGVNWILLEEVEPYAGVQTETLTISAVPAAFDQNKYRCLVYGQFCDSFTQTATLLVDTLTGTTNSELKIPDNKLTGYHFIDGSLQMNFFIQTPGKWKISLFDLNGRKLYESDFIQLNKGNQQHTIDLKTHPTNIILLRAATRNKKGKTYQITKTIMTNR